MIVPFKGIGRGGALPGLLLGFAAGPHRTLAETPGTMGRDT